MADTVDGHGVLTGADTVAVTLNGVVTANTGGLYVLALIALNT